MRVAGEALPVVGRALAGALVLAWSVPLLWMLLASVRAGGFGADAPMASLLPDANPTLANFAEAWASADFARYFVNTVMLCAGILAVQVVTMTLAGYAFARLEFPGRAVLFYLFLMQLALVPVVLLVPNLTTVVRLGLYDTLWGVGAPYAATAFGTFLMRQAFREVPRELEDAALMDGARWWHLVAHVYLPLTRPALTAFAIVSVVSHWNEFLWPLMVINDPDKRPLTLGLATFTRGAEGTQAWGVIAAGTLIVCGPLLAGYALFQRQFTASFMASGLK